HVHGRRHVTGQLHVGRLLLQLERNAQAAFDGLFARHGHPQHQRDAKRQGLQADVAKGPEAFHEYWTSARGADARRCSTSERRRTRSASPVRPRSIWPSTTIEMMPVSSDTTIAIASFSSVNPIAARWREPSSFASFGFTVSGRKHAAAATRSS